MFLKQIALTNFKCHSNLTLDFTCEDTATPIRKTTFILGENGTGKSALLKAIALVTAGSTALPHLLGEPDAWIRNKTPFCSIKAVIVNADGDERTIELRITRGHSLREIIHENSASLELLDAALAKADRNYFVIGYGASRRMGRQNSPVANRALGSQGLSPRATGVASLFNPDAALISLSSWAIDLDYTTKGSAMSVVQKALNEFLIQGVTFKKIDRSRKQLIFDTPDGEIPLEQLSDGYQNVAAWVGDLMYNITNTFSNYKNPLQARGLLLIDEIDLHLHPRWQRQLHAFLQDKLPRFQVIATTHSPLTAQQAQKEELYALQRNGSTVSVIPFEGDPSKMLVHQILMSPVFGLLTDESVKVETAKAEVSAIRLKAKPTASEKAQVKKLEQTLESVPINIRSNSLMEEKDFLLLKNINEALKSRRMDTPAAPAKKVAAKKVAGKKITKKSAAAPRARRK